MTQNNFKQIANVAGVVSLDARRLAFDAAMSPQRRDFLIEVLQRGIDELAALRPIKDFDDVK